MTVPAGRDWRDGLTPLMQAAQLRQLRRVARLCARNPADVCRADDAGYTALHWAARAGCSAVFEHLAATAPEALALRTCRGSTPADVALVAGSRACVVLAAVRGHPAAAQGPDAARLAGQVRALLAAASAARADRLATLLADANLVHLVERHAGPGWLAATKKVLRAKASSPR